MRRSPTLLAVPFVFAACALAQTFQRLGTCPELGCVFPPDQADFLPGQTFDIRVEVHAPVNGTEAYASGTPDESFYLEIQKASGKSKKAATFFDRQEPGMSFN